MDDADIGKIAKGATIVTGVGLASAGLSTLGGMGGAYIDGQKPLPNHELSAGDAAVERIIDQRYSTPPTGKNGTYSDAEATKAFQEQQSKTATPSAMTESQKARIAGQKIWTAEEQQIWDAEQQVWNEMKKAKGSVQNISTEEQKNQKDKDLAQYYAEKDKVNAERAKELEEIKTYNALHDTAENIGRGAGAAFPLGAGAVVGVHSLLEANRRKKAAAQGHEVTIV